MLTTQDILPEELEQAHRGSLAEAPLAPVRALGEEEEEQRIRALSPGQREAELAILEQRLRAAYQRRGVDAAAIERWEKQESFRRGVREKVTAPAAAAMKALGDVGHGLKGVADLAKGETIPQAYRRGVEQELTGRYLAEKHPGLTPVGLRGLLAPEHEQAVMGLALDVGIDLPIFWGAGRGAQVAGRGVRALGKKAAQRVAPRAVENAALRQALRGRVRDMRRGQQGIDVLGRRVEAREAKRATEIARGQGAGVPTAPRMLTTHDLTAAEIKLAQAKKTEVAAGGIARRFEKAQAIRPRLPGTKTTPAAQILGEQERGGAFQTKLHEIIGRRAQAQTTMGRIEQRVASRGRVPLSRRGVTFELPRPGERVSQVDVRNLMGALAERRSLSGAALTPADAEKEILAYAKSVGLNTAELQKSASRVRTIGRLYRRRIVRANVKTWDELNQVEREGGYLRQMYGRHVTHAEHEEWLRSNGFEAAADKLRNADLNRVEVLGSRARAPISRWNPRENIPIQLQHEMQAITDVVARLQGQRHATREILPRLEMYQRLARDPSVVSDTARSGWLRLPKGAGTERVDRLRALGYEDAARIAQEEVERGGWGALTGKYVPPPVYYAVNPQAMDWRKMGSLRGVLDQFEAFTNSALAPGGFTKYRVPRKGVAGLWHGLFGGVKRQVTMRNPVMQGYNKTSNWAMMHAYGGMPAHRVVPADTAAIGEILRGTEEWYQVSKRMPSLAQSGVLSEVQATVDTLRRANVGDHVARRTWDKVWNTFPGQVWQVNEASSKYGLIKYYWRQGAGRGVPITREALAKPGYQELLDKCIARAEAAIIDYGDVPRWIEWSRTFNPLAPFPTFAYKNVALFTEAMLFHPQRLQAYNIAKDFVEGGTPQPMRGAERELLYPYEESQFPVRLGGEDEYGQARYFLSGRATPWGSLEPAEMLDVSARSPFVIGPVAEALRGETAFGKQLYPRGTEWAEKLRIGGQYVASSYVPPLRILLAEREKAEKEEEFDWRGQRSAESMARLAGEAVVPGAAEERAKKIARYEGVPRGGADVAFRTRPLNVPVRVTRRLQSLERRKDDLWAKRREREAQRKKMFNEWPVREQEEFWRKMYAVDLERMNILASKRVLGNAR